MSKIKDLSENGSCPKRPRTDLTIDQKREIINWVEEQPSKPSHQTIANHFISKFGVRIGRTTISDILTQADRYLDNDNIRSYGYKRLRNAEQMSLEKALYSWYCEMCSYGCQLSDQILIAKAKLIGETVGVDSNFKYSNGWISKFKERHNISFKFINVEPSGIDKTLIDYEQSNSIDYGQLNFFI